MSLHDYSLSASVWVCLSPSQLTLLPDFALEQIRRVHSPIHQLCCEGRMGCGRQYRIKPRSEGSLADVCLLF